MDLITGPGQDDDHFVVNPARHDPTKMIAEVFGGSSPVAAVPSRPDSALPPHRAINFLVGLNLDSHVYSATGFGAAKDSLVKQILVCPLRGEFERSIGFFGSIFDQDALVVNTFGHSVGPVERMNGLTIRTVPTVPKTSTDSPSSKHSSKIFTLASRP